MNDNIAQSVNGSYGTINGVEIAEEMIARLAKNAEDGFPDTTFSSQVHPSRTDESTHAVTVRRSESELPLAGRYTYRVNWSSEDTAFLGTVDEFPSLSWLDKDQAQALSGIHNLVVEVLTDMRENGEAEAQTRC